MRRAVAQLLLVNRAGRELLHPGMLLPNYWQTMYLNRCEDRRAFAVREKGIAELIRGRPLEQVPLLVRGVVHFDEPPLRHNALLHVTREDGDDLTVFVKDIALEQLPRRAGKLTDGPIVRVEIHAAEQALAAPRRGGHALVERLGVY